MRVNIAIDSSPNTFANIFPKSKIPVFCNTFLSDVLELISFKSFKNIKVRQICENSP